MGGRLLPLPARASTWSIALIIRSTGPLHSSHSSLVLVAIRVIRQLLVFLDGSRWNIFLNEREEWMACPLSRESTVSKMISYNLE